MTQVSRIPLTKEVQKRIFEIFLDAVAEVKEKREVSIFVKDLFSPTEQMMLAKRLSIALLLYKGYDQRSISKLLKVSLNTINRVSLGFKIGGDGFRNVIRKIEKKDKQEEFWNKLDDLIADILPPRGRNWSAWRKERYLDKRAKQKLF